MKGNSAFIFVRYISYVGEELEVRVEIERETLNT